ncbi:hypothetical protein [Maribacter sp. 2308TA10-17]|uniref:hypothetical protein n=1 Tax=Maribacter sp. 2308TA10-17 TaxID=3386276 RepID=UPI0039BC8E06
MKKASIVLVFLSIFLHSCNTKAQNTMKQSEFAETFITDFKAYEMDIQAAGIASIPVARLSEGKTLYIEYVYASGGENRNGKMTLMLNPKSKRFEGGWKTLADNGNSYEGDMYFVFTADGQASGFYTFGGADYKITIFKK